jgi:hypothetical protein
MGDVVYLRRDDEDARRVLDATIELLREIPYTSLTMRAINVKSHPCDPSGTAFTRNTTGGYVLCCGQGHGPKSSRLSSSD